MRVVMGAHAAEKKEGYAKNPFLPRPAAVPVRVFAAGGMSVNHRDERYGDEVKTLSLQ